MSEIRDQDEINIEYLNHTLRNNIVIIGGLFKKIEESLKIMNDAVKAYDETA